MRQVTTEQTDERRTPSHIRLMIVPFVDLSAARDELGQQLRAATDRVLKSGRYILGPELEHFEEGFARYLGVKYCVGVGSGLDALHLALRAMGIGPGDEVIVPANTFVATWLAVSRAGALPVAVDIDPNTFNIDPNRVEAALSDRTKVLLPVHLYGHPADMTFLLELARRHDLKVLEDAAQAHGARWEGRSVGGLGDAAAWSFYPTKNLGALGDGGAVTTNDLHIARTVKLLRNYGSSRRYECETQGHNSRLDELQAAVLSVKLEWLDEWNSRRRNIATEYQRALYDCPVDLPTVAPGVEHVWHLFVIRTRHRELLQTHLASDGIESIVHYPVPPYSQGAYPSGTWRASELSVSDQIHREVLSIPIGPHMTPEQVRIVIEAIRRFDPHVRHIHHHLPAREMSSNSEPPNGAIPPNAKRKAEDG